MATCTLTVICQSGTLGCIICWEIKYDIVFIMNSLLWYIVLAILVIIYIRPNIWEFGQFWTFLLYLPSFSSLWHDLHMNSFCLISQYHFDNALASRYVQVIIVFYKYYIVIPWQIISMAACAHTSIFLWFCDVSIVISSVTLSTNSIQMISKFTWPSNWRKIALYHKIVVLNSLRTASKV